MGRSAFVVIFSLFALVVVILLKRSGPRNGATKFCLESSFLLKTLLRCSSSEKFDIFPVVIGCSKFSKVLRAARSPSFLLSVNSLSSFGLAL